MIALGKRGNRIFVGMSDPTNEQVMQEVKFATGMTMEPVVVEDDKLSIIVRKFAESTGKALEMATEDVDLSGVEVTDGEAQPEVATEEIDDAPVVKYVQKILLDAINGGASDIHFEPYEKFYRIRYRTDGMLYDIAQPPLAIKEKIASRIKVVSRLDISEKRVPQDGRMKIVLSKTRAIDFRVSTLPTLFGEKICMRILDPSSATLGIEALGYEPEQKESLMRAIQRPYGMVLVTGPTGSGKTVSLYTCLNILNKPGINISTAEDPAEINLPGINQVNMNDKAGPHLRGGAQGVPAPGPGHHHGGRDPRPRDRRDRDQGRADRPHGALDAAHQRRARHAHAPHEHGHRAVQHRLVGDPHHGAAPGAEALHLQEAGGHPGRGAASAPVSRRTTWTARGSPTSPSAASCARIPATRGASASTR